MAPSMGRLSLYLTKGCGNVLPRPRLVRDSEKHGAVLQGQIESVAEETKITFLNAISKEKKNQRPEISTAVQRMPGTAMTNSFG